MKRVFSAALLALALLGTAVAAEKLNGAGATFPYPIYSKWFNEYHKQHPDVEINYQSIGSGGGIAQIIAGTVDFGASDGPMTDEKLAEAKRKILHIPTVLGADVPAYNLPGVSADLKFTPDALAGIFLGTVKKWNDPLIAKSNPGVKLPDKDIIVVHRSEGSGTTYIWTDYLSKISPDWKNKVGRGASVNWPVGLGQKGNEGVSGQIRQMEGAIGYIELTYALQNNISFGSVQNSAGQFIKANLDSVTAAAASSPDMPEDFRVSITNAPGKNAYPISSFTWLLVPADWSDKNKEKIMVDFLNWMVTSGEKMTTDLSYAPLPKNVADKVRARLKEIH